MYDPISNERKTDERHVAIIEAFKKHGTLTLPELQDITGYSITSISSSIKKFKQLGWIKHENKSVGYRWLKSKDKLTVYERLINQ